LIAGKYVDQFRIDLYQGGAGTSTNMNANEVLANIALEKAGFKKVMNLQGGIFDWVNNGYPVYDNDGNETKKVHAYDKSWGKWLTKGEKVYE
jgi:fumarate hydratase class II